MSVWRPSLRLAVVLHGSDARKLEFPRTERARTIIGETADSAIGEIADSAKLPLSVKTPVLITSGVVIAPFRIAGFRFVPTRPNLQDSARLLLA
jgi:hypothetical protein